LRFNNHQEILRFVTSMAYNVVLGKKEWGLAKVFLPNQNIFKIKKLDSMLML
jgi:hypothetical protein